MRRITALLWVLCSAAIVWAAWVHRYAMNPDGISYLDLASRLLHGDASPLLHPYWSPLFPCVLAAVLKIAAPGAATEVLVVHAALALIALGALTSFAFFVREWLPREAGPGWIAFAYVMFLWATVEWIGLEFATPDLLVSAFVYLAAGIGCRIALRRAARGDAIVLGVVLGLAYLTKAAMLPAGIAMLLLLAWHPGAMRPVMTAAVALAITAGPQILALSVQQGRPTIGDSGRLNYAWLVVGEVPIHAGWTGGPHSPRVLNQSPLVLEYAGAVPGTQPLWYNPAFFYEGLRLNLDSRKQVAVLRNSASEIVHSHGKRMAALFLALAVLVVMWLRGAVTLSAMQRWVILWALAGVCEFALVTPQSRYIAPALCLGWMGITGAFRGHAVSTVLLVAAIGLALPLVRLLGPAPLDRSDMVAAAELANSGVKSGERIAVTADPFRVYYARLAGVQVSATIGFSGGEQPLRGEQFWELDDVRRNDLIGQLRSAGVRAIVGREDCPGAVARGARLLGDSGYCVLML